MIPKLRMCKLSYSVTLYRFNNYLHNLVAYCTIMSRVSTPQRVILLFLTLCFPTSLIIKNHLVCIIFHPLIYFFELLNNYFFQSNIYIYSLYLCVILFKRVILLNMSYIN